MSRRSGRDISRASTTFCWLPPDRVLAWASIEPVRTSNSAIRFSAFSRTAAGLQRDAAGEGLVAVQVEDEVLRDGEVGDDAVGASGPPGRTRGRRRARRATDRPDQLDAVQLHASRRRACCSPSMTSVSSVWPLPCTPAIATISPRATSNETSSSCRTPASSMTVRLRTWTVASPGTAAVRATPRSTERPTMSEASSVSGDVGSALPTTLPRRMTVIRSATARTSRSLCVMKTIDVPDSLSWRMIAISSSVSCGVSTAVGSSRMRTLACRDSALMISTRCWTPTGRSSM